MKLYCTSCGQEIPGSDYNISTDLAYCRACDREYSVASLRSLSEIDSKVMERFVLKHLSRDNKNQLEFRFSRMVLIFLIPFTALWSGGAITGIYIVPIAEGKFDTMLALFGIPFLIGTIILLGVIFFILFEKTRLLIEHGQFLYTISAGPFTFRRKDIPVDSGTMVTLMGSGYRVNNRVQRQLCIETNGETLKCGAMMLKEAEIELVLTWVQMKLASQSR